MSPPAPPLPWGEPWASAFHTQQPSGGGGFDWIAEVKVGRRKGSNQGLEKP